MMRLWLRVARLIVLAAAVLLLVYPALHELGHLAAAYAVGARVGGVQLFPVAYARVDIGECGQQQAAAVAMSGGLFPLLSLLITSRRRYCLYYTQLTVAVVSAFAAVTSAVNAAAFLCGIERGYDDAVTALRVAPGAVVAIGAILGAELAASLAFCVLSKPLRRITDDLDR